MPKHNNLKCETKLGTLEGVMERFRTDDVLCNGKVFGYNYCSNSEDSEKLNEWHKYTMLGVVSQDDKTLHYQFHSVNNLNSDNYQMSNPSTITHYFYLHSFYCNPYYTPYSVVEFKLLDLKTKTVHSLKDANSNLTFMYCDCSGFFANVYQSVSLTNNNEISNLKNVKSVYLQPIDEYQLLDIIYWVKINGYYGTRIIINFKNILLSKIVKLNDNVNYNHLRGINFWGNKESVTSLSNTCYFYDNETNEFNIWVLNLSHSLKDSISFLCLNNSQQQQIIFENENFLNINYENNLDKYISLVKVGNNFSKESVCNEQYIIHFIKKMGIYKLFKLDPQKSSIFYKEVKNIKLLTNLEIIDCCLLNKNFYLLATNRENSKNHKVVTTIEEFLLYRHILFFLLDLNSFTINKISPIVYPLRMSKQLINTIARRKELEEDGFKVVTSKRKYCPNFENCNNKIYVNNKVNINGGVTNDELYRNYLLGDEKLSFNNSSLSFQSGVAVDNFTMTSFKEFNETNKDIFNVTLSFHQMLKAKEKCDPFFITLYFKVKDCCSGVISFNNQELSDVSIDFKQ
ncbi:hypothetical protein ABK040_000358 [Willaertia magna]